MTSAHTSGYISKRYLYRMNNMRTGRRVSPAALVAAAAALLSFVDGAVNLTNVTPIEKGCKGPQDGIDGKGTANAVVCQACEGFCTTDADCSGHLRCFHRDLVTPVPGCGTAGEEGKGAVDWDYCYDPGTGYLYQTPWHQTNWNPPQHWNNPRNWLPPWKQPTPNHQPTPATSSKRLYSTNAAGCGSKGCVQCEGDCDSDADCEGNLTCFKRDGLESVPGCGSGGFEAWDYCVSSRYGSKETRMPTKRPATGPAPAPSPPIKSIGNNACKDGSCRLCEGDCDSDADCGGGLRCFQRDNIEAVPGCMGSGHGAWDYCIANP